MFSILYEHKSYCGVAAWGLQIIRNTHCLSMGVRSAFALLHISSGDMFEERTLVFDRK